MVDWAPRGSPALVEGIRDVLRAHPGTSALLLANHGLLAFAPTPALDGAKDFPASALEQVQASMSGTRTGAGTQQAAWGH